MLIDQIVKMVSQILLMMLMTRFLGVEDLGRLMYCYALVSIFLFLNILGMDGLLIKKFVQNKDSTEDDIKNTLFIRIIASVLCVILVNVFGIFIIDDNDKNLLLIISTYHFFLPITVLGWYFSSQGLGYLTAYGSIVGTIIGFIFRFFVMYNAYKLEWLGLAYVIESLVTAIMYIFISKHQGVSYISSKIDKYKIKSLLKESYPLMLSSALTILYMKVDQLMLGYMIGKSEVGIYTAGSRLSEAWFMFGGTLIGAYFPKLLETYDKHGVTKFRSELLYKGRLLFIFSVFLAIITSLISPNLIVFLYGNDFLESSIVLTVSIWAVPFVFLGGISTRLYIQNGTQYYVLLRSFFGLLVNIIANYFLIPLYGALGASIATLSSQVISGYLCNYFGKGYSIFILQSKMILFMCKK
jgi:O-antigen/teichoic acid export membrane protein